MAALLARASGPEAKVIVRVARGRLRLGIGDQTVLDGAALAALHDRGAKTLLEAAYNVRSDLGEVVHLAFAKGQRGLAKITPEIGVPVRPALAQRLGSAEEIIARLGTVQAEPKYDGFRLQLHRDGDTVWTFSRRLENVTEMFPDLVEAARTQLASRRAIIEGEAVVYDPRTGHFSPFQVTMTRKRKTNIAEHARAHPLRLFAFDVLTVDGRSQLAAPQRERTARLAKLVRARKDGTIAVTGTFVTSDATELEGYFDDMLHRGLEGIVAKRLDAPYRAGARGYDWVKLKRAYASKLRDTVDVVLVGYLRGRGKRAALGIGSLLGAAYDPEHDRFCSVAKIGSGLSDAAWRDLRRKLDARSVRKQPANVDSTIQPDVWVEPALVVEVLADEISRSPFHTCGKHGKEPGYALRFPRIVAGPRSDKAPRDATTVQEIVDMYRLQGGKREAVGTERQARRPARRRPV
jgi:DNA ligase-1